MKEIHPVNHGLPFLVDEDTYDVIKHYKFVLRIDRRVSRAIYKHLFGEIPKGYHVDHINRNPLDNRRENLRVITASENMKNKGDMVVEEGPDCNTDIRQAKGRQE